MAEEQGERRIAARNPVCPRSPAADSPRQLRGEHRASFPRLGRGKEKAHCCILPRRATDSLPRLCDPRWERKLFSFISISPPFGAILQRGRGGFPPSSLLLFQEEKGRKVRGKSSLARKGFPFYMESKSDSKQQSAHCRVKQRLSAVNMFEEGVNHRIC